MPEFLFYKRNVAKITHFDVFLENDCHPCERNLEFLKAKKDMNYQVRIPHWLYCDIW